MQRHAAGTPAINVKIKNSFLGKGIWENDPELKNLFLPLCERNETGFLTETGFIHEEGF